MNTWRRANLAAGGTPENIGALSLGEAGGVSVNGASEEKA